MKAIAHSGSVALALRPDAGFHVRGDTVEISIGGDDIGEFRLTRSERRVLPFLNEAIRGDLREVAVTDFLERRGHSRRVVRSLFDTLVDSGLAVRYSIDMDRRCAAAASTWTSRIDEAFGPLASAAIAISTSDDNLAEFSREFGRWNARRILRFEVYADSSEYSGPEAAFPALVIVCLPGFRQWRSLSLWCARNQVPLLPVRIGIEANRVGPLFVRGVSACPACTDLENGPVEHLGDSGGTLPGGTVSAVAQLGAEFLAGRGDQEQISAMHVFDRDGTLLESRPGVINPRCPACSRLDRYPENAVIHG